MDPQNPCEKVRHGGPLFYSTAAEAEIGEALGHPGLHTTVYVENPGTLRVLKRHGMFHRVVNKDASRFKLE